MTERTLTTEGIRSDFIQLNEQDHSRVKSAEEFDRWLNEIRAEAWDEGHGYPCDKWIRSEMCREYHPNPYRPNEK